MKDTSEKLELEIVSYVHGQALWNSRPKYIIPATGCTTLAIAMIWSFLCASGVTDWHTINRALTGNN